MKFSLRSLLIAIFLSFPFFVFSAGITYHPLQNVRLPNGDPLNNPNILQYLVNIYTFAIAIAGGLAVIRIVYAGIKYMLTDIVTTKGDARKEIEAAVYGLLVVLCSYVFLNTLNPNLVKFNLFIPQSQQMAGDGRDLINGPLIASGVMSPGGKLNPLNSSGSGSKITAYGYSGDTTPDSNSTEARGDHDNLLTEGSVALSTDVIANLQPQHGAAVYVGDTFIGYYDDQTAPSYKGRPILNTVDRYDPTGSLGGNSYSQAGGPIRIDNNNIRASVTNPSRK